MWQGGGQSKAYLFAFAMWIGFILLNLVRRLCDVINKELTTTTSIGTLHSCRYVNLALWFTENDKIPILNQSYGQAMLGSMSRMLGVENTNFTLVLWLAASAAFLHLFVYGMLRRRYKRWLSVVLTSVVTMGSVSLTLYPVLVVDSGYPLMQNGYTDSVAGCVTFVIYLVYLIHILEGTHKLTIFDYLFSVVWVLYWVMSAPQNIVITGAVGVCFICRLLVKKDYDLVKNAMKVAGAILCGCLLGILEGGMLTPGFLVEQIDLAGVMQFSRDSDTALGISLIPVMPYYISGLKSSSWGEGYLRDIVQRLIDEFKNENLGLTVHYAGLLVWDSIRIVFWPLVGIALTVCAAYRRKKFDYRAASGAVMFATGYVIAFGFALNNYKWELSRFMMPAYFVGMIFLAFWLGRIWEEKRYRSFVMMAVGLILAGNLPYAISNMIGKCHQNDVFRLLKEMILFTDRYI
ncbi:MAG: hypothetical protein NC302_01230 [Bacteroidales bacterium]|nr:hypothetical protein [Bacteroidales bacterium]MCM1414505.1 hypothetical protein [bacterium]